MTHDPDILAIQRKRRQEGHCIPCGRPVECPNGRPPVLCEGCREKLAYCPNCERLFARRKNMNPRHATEYCAACNTLNKRTTAGKRPRAQYITDIQAKRHALLPTLIKYYRSGENLTMVAPALGLTRPQIDRIIRDARARGEWPDELRRNPHRRKATNGR